MQQLKSVYPEFADDVSFYAVGMFPDTSIDVYEKFRMEKDYPWPVAVPQGALLPDLGVITQSTKISFNAEGIITHRNGMGGGNPEIWREVFTSLSAMN